MKFCGAQDGEKGGDPDSPPDSGSLCETFFCFFGEGQQQTLG